ncbi:hypothetical protein ABZP36_004814 [Zizania latifolia]
MTAQFQYDHTSLPIPLSSPLPSFRPRSELGSGTAFLLVTEKRTRVAEAAAQRSSYIELPEPSTISELARNSGVPTDSTRLNRSEVSRLHYGPRATAAMSSAASRGGGQKKLSAERFARIDCECDVPAFLVLLVRISELR